MHTDGEKRSGFRQKAEPFNIQMSAALCRDAATPAGQFEEVSDCIRVHPWLKIRSESAVPASSTGLVKFFSAAQIATRCRLPQIIDFIFSSGFPSKTGGFMNRLGFGIGIA
jgi:hypothetical protein